MESNYYINKRLIIDDFYKCIGAFENCRLLYNCKDCFKIFNSDSEEEKRIKIGRMDDLLSELGKVGEKSFKYILGLELLKTYPNYDYKSFEVFFKKSSALCDFAERHGIDRNDSNFVKLINYDDSCNQKTHNFDYWYSIIEFIMKEISNKFKKYIEYSCQSEMLVDFFKGECLHDDALLPLRIAVFPKCFDNSFESIPSISEEYLENIIDLIRKSLKKSGDIFTRFRYASNNKDNKSFNIDEVYENINYIVDFIKLIHSCNDDLYFDIDKMFANKRALELADLINIDKKDMVIIFSLNLDDFIIEELLFGNFYSYQDIINLLKVGVSKDDLGDVIELNLMPSSVEYFFKQGITDYNVMRDKLDSYIVGAIIDKKRKIL